MTPDIGDEQDIAAIATAMRALQQHRKLGETWPSVFTTRPINAGETIAGSALDVKFTSIHDNITDSFLSSKDQVVGRIALNDIASGVEVSVDDLEPAECYYQRLLDIAEAALGPNSFEVARLLILMANSYWNSPRLELPFDFNKYVQAEKLYRRALAIHEDVCGKNSPEAADDCLNIAMMCKRLERYPEEGEFLRQALAIYEVIDSNLFASEHNGWKALLALCWHYSEDNDDAMAEESLSKVVEAKERAVCRSLLELRLRLICLADLYCEHQKFLEADLVHRRIVTMTKRIFGQANVEVASCLRDYARFLAKANRTVEGQQLIAQAKEIEASVD